MSRKRKRGNGEGSIYQLQDGRWRAAISIGKDSNGKPKRKIFTKATRHEVRDELTKALRDAQIGIPVVTGKKTLAESSKSGSKRSPRKCGPRLCGHIPTS